MSMKPNTVLFGTIRSDDQLWRESRTPDGMEFGQRHQIYISDKTGNYGLGRGSIRPDLTYAIVIDSRAPWTWEPDTVKHGLESTVRVVQIEPGQATGTFDSERRFPRGINLWIPWDRTGA